MSTLRKFQSGIDKAVTAVAQRIGLQFQKHRCVGEHMVIRDPGSNTNRSILRRSLYRSVPVDLAKVMAGARAMIEQVRDRFGAGCTWTVGDGHVHIVADDGRIAFRRGEIMLRMFYVHEYDRGGSELLGEQWPWPRGEDGDTLVVTDVELGRMAIERDRAAHPMVYVTTKEFRAAPAEIPTGRLVETLRGMASAGMISVEECRGLMEMPLLEFPPPDPLDVEYDGVKLRELVTADESAMRSETPPNRFTPAQRAAVSAHWSAELRAKVAASKERKQRTVTLEYDE